MFCVGKDQIFVEEIKDFNETENSKQLSGFETTA